MYDLYDFHISPAWLSWWLSCITCTTVMYHLYDHYVSPTWPLCIICITCKTVKYHLYACWPSCITRMIVMYHLYNLCMTWPVSKAGTQHIIHTVPFTKAVKVLCDIIFYLLCNVSIRCFCHTTLITPHHYVLWITQLCHFLFAASSVHTNQPSLLLIFSEPHILLTPRVHFCHIRPSTSPWRPRMEPPRDKTRNQAHRFWILRDH